MQKPLRCPTCQKQFQIEESPRMPFCSLRCAEIDLGRWLSEKNGLPYEGGEEELEEAFFESFDNSP